MSVSSETSSRNSSSLDEKTNRFYKCPSCRRIYDFIRKNDDFIARIPLILKCGHVVCESCISKSIKKGHIVCFICNKLSAIPRNQSTKLDELFTPHYSIIGYLSWSTNRPVKRNINLVSTGITLNKEYFNAESLYMVSESQDLDDNLKLSQDSLSSDKQVNLDFGCCSEHNGSYINIHCSECDMNLCCYCFVEDHGGHQHVTLYKLNEAQLKELEKHKNIANKVLKELVSSQRKLKHLNMCECTDTSNVEHLIRNYFNDLHGKLHIIEAELKQKLNSMMTNNEEIETINKTLQTEINYIKKLLSSCNLINEKQINVHVLLEQLKKIENIPCHLVTKLETVVNEPIKFIIKEDPFANIEENFKITKTKTSEYNLVCLEDANDDDNLNEEITEIPDRESEISEVSSVKTEDLDSTCSSNSATASLLSALSNIHITSEPSYKNRKKSHDHDFNDKETVIMTHMNNLDSFYVQLKKSQHSLQKLQKLLIKNFHKVDSPVAGEIYNAYYITKNCKFWRRGKVLDIVEDDNNELKYNVFFIDFGNTKYLTKNQFKYLNRNLIENYRPFAIHCKLHNPTNIVWDKNAHIHLANIFDRQDLTVKFINKLDDDKYEVDLLFANSIGDYTSIINILNYDEGENLDETSSTSSVTSLQYFPNFRFYKNSKTFEKGEREQVLITHITDPEHIYVQLTQNFNVLNTMEYELNEYYSNKKVKSCIPVEDTDVIVQYQIENDMKWFRGTVKQVDKKNTTAQVFLVDTGLTITVPWSNLRILSEHFTKVECQAILISLTQIKPIQEEWSKETIKYLKEQILKKTFKMVIVDNTLLEVVLFESLRTVDLSINALLVENNFALSTGDVSLIKHWPQQHHSTSIDNTDDHLTIRLLKNAEKTILANDDNLEGTDCPKELVTIMHCESPDMIVLKYLNQSEEEQQLHEELQAHYVSQKDTKNKWKEREHCVVLDNESKTYKRGIVMGKLNNDKYKIYLYDEMKEIFLKIEQIYIIIPYFHRFKRIAYCYRLGNIKPAGDYKNNKWPNTAIDLLQKIFQIYKVIYFKKIIDKNNIENERESVEMWYSITITGSAIEPSERKFVSINELLVEAGVALNNRIKDNEKSITKETDLIGDNLNIDHDINLIHNVIKDKEERIISNWLKPAPIDSEIFDALVKSVDKNGFVYIRDLIKDNCYLLMEKTQNDHFNSLDKNTLTQEIGNNWKLGQMCTILYEDAWYRGTVTEIVSPSEIVVNMIDFGSEHVVNRNQLYKEIMYVELEPFINKVQLYDVVPKNNHWEPDDINTLIDNMSDKVVIKVIGNINYDIPLVEIYNGDGQNINKLITKKCPNLIRIGETSSDEDESESDFEKPLSQDNNSLYKFLPLPVNSNKIKMSIKSVLNYDTIVLGSLSTEYTTNLSELCESIEKAAAEQPKLKTIQLNMPCICLSSDDSTWRRGLIYDLDNLDDHYVSVFIVDSGFIETIEINELKVMKSEWFNVPVSNYFAKIAIKLLHENQKDNIMKEINKLCGKIKFIEIISNDPLIVHLYNGSKLCYHHLINNGVLADIS